MHSGEWLVIRDLSNSAVVPDGMFNLVFWRVDRNAPANILNQLAPKVAGGGGILAVLCPNDSQPPALEAQHLHSTWVSSPLV